MSLKPLCASSLFLLMACGNDLGNGAIDPPGELQAQRVCASKSVEGVDVSKYEGSIDWPTVAASGRRFAFTRIGDGLGGDATFQTNWAGIKAAGMYRGAYQFFRPGDDPAAQAEIVTAAVGHLGPGDLPVALDIEVTDGVSASTIVAHMKTWLQKVQASTGKRPVIYSSPGFWPSLGNPNFSQDPIWVANWYVSCPRLPAHYSTWRFWQYSDMGTVPGIGSVDVDRFFGSESDLAAYANGAGSEVVSPDALPAEPPASSDPDTAANTGTTE